ncbi:MAG: SusD/RagB family nutrient-binding outer membrane lipoprotein [Candidatus Pseudobacter hemicellulosilyticus]|uniref:SusD/RagB family nutrient-binding outer membrane lipoprotein n=1 Tax=Candidatus Pseudobacter hemicellulosilyticus TaxID=3121375 RepID=A0AAJ5WPA8_9BACT|nr:MAG: SusD/RagB family nutrient-binding outer membrane lipoprotein [Pseudobacter sp.]
MKRFINYIVVSTLILGTSSCEKFLDVNDNPNSPTSETLPLNAKLAAPLLSSAIQETGQLNQIGALWAGYWGTNNEGISQFVDLKTYNGPAIRHQRDGIPVWEDGFNNLLYYQLLKEEALAENEYYYAGLSKIMQGWHFLRLVDMYNNIPFDDALQGTKNPTPRYEAGSVVYEKAINLITDGIQDMKNTIPGTEAGTDDILFQGNKSSWIKFANTIKLRALLRQSEVGNNAYIQAELLKIRNEGSGFLNTGENAFIQPGYTTSNANSFWTANYRVVGGATSQNHQNVRPTEYLLEQYELRADPRLPKLYVAVGGAYKGVRFGNPSVTPDYAAAATSPFKGPNENANQPAALFKSAIQPLVLMGSFESLFLQAEAAQRGWTDGDAASLYQSAIQESFKYMEVAASEFTGYYAQTTVNFNDATNKIERIIEQKWLALNSISSLEAWNDYRRLGIPAVPNSLEAPTPQSRPLRLMYPETERMTNNENASLQGSDDMISAKVWWDQ